MSTPINIAPTALIESLRGLVPTVLIESLRDFSPAALLNLLQQQPPTKTIATAIALIAAYHVYFNELELNKPKQYRNIPKVNGYHVLFYMLKGESFPRRYEYCRELTEANGIIRTNNLQNAILASSRLMRRQFRTLGTDFVTIGSAELAREFLHDTDTFRKLTFSEDLGEKHLTTKFLGQTSVLLSNGNIWKRHRKIANPAFHKSWNTDVFGGVSARLGREVDRLTKEEGIDVGVEVHKLMQRLTLDALGLAAFGFDFQSIENPNGPYVSVYNHLAEAITDATYFLFPVIDRYPIGSRARLHEEIKIFDKLIFDIIDSKREQIRKQGDDFDEASADLLTMMIRATDQESPEKGLSKKELRDNMSVFFLAGHDTTANALACAFYYLAANPAVQSKARAEILSVMGDRDSDPDPDTIPTIEQTKSFVYVNLVMKESMRLSPSVVQLPARTVDNDTVLGEYLIPKHTQVLLNIYSIHHNPKYWGKDVEEFRPERFEDESKRDPLAWLPFSSGSRSCIGTNFSLIEQRVVLAMFRKSHHSFSSFSRLPTWHAAHPLISSILLSTQSVNTSSTYPPTHRAKMA
ncbi:cytochrome P450 [Endogone sp. FLAS-F59071]|nr:cytochrome P450 [Endogone sp. FLAS-F59071]|eukprot:RUS17576.1 cytochrome P450 [Endogone sp. FLAS-F59071]